MTPAELDALLAKLDSFAALDSEWDAASARAIRALRQRVEEQAKALRSVIALFDESDETRNYQNEPARDARISVNGLEQIRALIGDPHA